MSDDDITQPSGMPLQPKTKELQAPSAVEIAIAKLTHTVEERFDRTDANISLVSSDLGVVKDRVTILENERTKLSGGVRNLSSADEQLAAAMAAEKVAREALAAKVDAHDSKLDGLDKKQDLQLTILSRLDNITKNPLVKTVGAMLATAFITWLATHGIQVPK